MFKNLYFFIMSQLLVSVIIPNYCHARYLDQRIQSVLVQTYQNFEIIILDDCSPDDGASRAVIEKYRSNPHVSHIVYNEVNSGSPFIQWEKGISLAHGELIWIAESDDACEPTLLEELVARLDENPNASVAFCRTIAFDEGIFYGEIGPKNIKDGLIKGPEFIHDYMRSGCGIVNASSAVFRKSSIAGISNEYKTYRGSGDRLFWIEMAEQGDVVFIDKQLNFFRTHTNNSTKNNGNIGVNQREDKLILDYLLSKRYISRKEYRICADIYVRVHIFEMVTDKKLKDELYKIWGYSKVDQWKLRISAWKKRILG